MGFNNESDSAIIKWIVGIVGGLFVLITLFMAMGSVPAGFVGVHTRFSAVKGTIEPGFYIVMPWTDGVTTMDVQTQKKEVNATAASSDLQNVSAIVAINFHVLPNDAATIFQNIGTDYKSRIIDPAIQESIKSITANYTAEQLITKRAAVRDEIFALLSTKLDVYGIKTDSINIVNFDYSDSFNTAIEAKVTAQQNALAAENKLAQVKFEAQQRISQAEGEARAIGIQAAAINSQGGADYVELQRIKEWDGHGCTSYCGLTTSTGLLINAK